MIPAPLVSLNYQPLREFLFDERHLSLAKNSMGLAAGTAGLSVVFGVLLAFLLSRTDFWGRRLFKVFYLIPILIPPYIHAIVWTHMNVIIKQFSPLDIHSLYGGIIVLTLAYFPFVTLITISGLKSIDRNLEEASLLSHGAWHTLKGVTLPLVTPHILSGAIFVFIFTVVDFGVPDILRINVYPLEIFIQFSAFYNEHTAMLLSFPLITVTMVLVLMLRWYMGARSYVNLTAGTSGQITYQLRKFKVLSLLFCLALLGLSVLLPIAVLLKKAGSLSNYVRILDTSIDQIGYSLFLALIGGLITLFLSFFISDIIERVRRKTVIALEFVSLIPFAIPATTIGIGLIKVWNRPLLDFVYGCPLIIILGYITHTLPFVIQTTTAGLKQVSLQVEHAGFLGTESWTKVLRKITIPLTMPSLMAGFFISFILSLGELGTTLLVIPPGRETMPIKIYNLMHYGAEQMVAALCLILVMIILLFSGFFLMFYKKFTKRVFR